MPTSASRDLDFAFPPHMIMNPSLRITEKEFGLLSPLFGSEQHGFRYHPAPFEEQLFSSFPPHVTFNELPALAHSHISMMQSESDLYSAPWPHGSPFTPPSLLTQHFEGELETGYTSPRSLLFPGVHIDLAFSTHESGVPAEPSHDFANSSPVSSNSLSLFEADNQYSPHAEMRPSSSSTDLSVDVGRGSRLVIACGQCRARKIRCDSTRPMCNNCSRRSSTCEYDAMPKRRGPDKRPGMRRRSCKKRVINVDAAAAPTPVKRKRMAGARDGVSVMMRIQPKGREAVAPSASVPSALVGMSDKMGGHSGANGNLFRFQIETPSSAPMAPHASPFVVGKLTPKPRPPSY